jgi:hypothetical protein
MRSKRSSYEMKEDGTPSARDNTALRGSSWTRSSVLSAKARSSWRARFTRTSRTVWARSSSEHGSVRCALRRSRLRSMWTLDSSIPARVANRFTGTASVRGLDGPAQWVPSRFLTRFVQSLEPAQTRWDRGPCVFDDRKGSSPSARGDSSGSIGASWFF